MQAVVLVFVFPFEAPKYLLLNDRRKECEDLLHVIYKDEYF
jgi:hypothetical protein